MHLRSFVVSAVAIVFGVMAAQANELPSEFRTAATSGFRSQAQIAYVAAPPEAKRAKINKVTASEETKSILDNSFENNQSRALLGARGGDLFYERYSFGVSRYSTPLGFSMSKSLTALTVGQALCEGKISSIEDQVKKYVPALAGTSWGESSIHDVLRMTSGANSTTMALNGWNTRETGDLLNEVYFGRLRTDYVDFLRRDDDRRYAAGTLFNYNNFDTIVLGLLVEQATATSFPAYFEKSVWSNVGAESRGAWIINGKKQTATYMGFSATPHDWLRVGMMVLKELKDTTTCSGKFLKEAVSSKISASGSGLGSGYGYQIWRDCGPDVDFCFIGYGGQYLLFNVEHDVVIYHHAITLSPNVRSTPYLMSALIYSITSR